MAANLTYYIFDGVLIGMAGGKMFHVLARSGGGGEPREAARLSPETTPT